MSAIDEIFGVEPPKPAKQAPEQPVGVNLEATVEKNREADLKKQFWKERTFWSDGYFVCSTGDASVDTIRKYIQEQG